MSGDVEAEEVKPEEVDFVEEDMATQLRWLADAPLFVDGPQVQKLFDALVHPHSKIASILQIKSDTVETAYKGKGKTSLAAKAILEGSISLSVEREDTNEAQQGQTVTHIPIDNPERQLIALAVHYIDKKPSRVFFVTDRSKPGWRKPEKIAQPPRTLVFLELPGVDQVKEGELPTILVPTAAEFSNGKVVMLFPQLSRKNGERPLDYPEVAKTPDDLKKARQEYWNWFRTGFSARQAMQVVEKNASKNGSIRWIDFRLPLTADGDTLHLHIRPAGNYDTGDLAYNLIKRGFKHGIRLVGTLKSEPDMNVLAIYER